jgi:flagellar basal body-associated protein FliL
MSRKILVIVIVVAVSCAGAAFHAVPMQQTSQRDKTKANAKALLDVAHRGLASVERTNLGNRDVYVWSTRVLNAELTLSENADERIAAMERYLKLTKEQERVVIDLFGRKLISKDELLEAEYYRCEAEVLLDLEREANANSRK